MNAQDFARSQIIALRAEGKKCIPSLRPTIARLIQGYRDFLRQMR